MTREEEIHNVANTISTNIGKEIDEDYICNDVYDFTIGFECGAKWADKTMLEKVCEWLSEIDFDSDYFRDAEDYFDNDKIIEEFKKAMEE